MRDDGIRSACTDKRNNNNNSTLNACMPYGLFLANEPSQMKSQLSHLYSEHKYNGAFNSFLQNNRDTWNICFDNNNFSFFHLDFHSFISNIEHIPVFIGCVHDFTLLIWGW